MKYLFLTNIPSPYRVDFFNELGKLCDVTVAFETGASKERDASWKRYDIKRFNPAAERAFQISHEFSYGKPISIILDDDDFVNTVESGIDAILTVNSEYLS